MTPLLALLALAALVVALAALARANARDRRAMGERLGLAPVTGAPAERSDDPILGRRTDSTFLRGTLGGFPAEVRQRTVRRRRTDPGAKSHFTVLALAVPPGPARLRLTPARIGAAAAAVGGDWPGWLTGDAAFDAAFRLDTPEPHAAAALLDGPTRARLLALRDGLAGPMPDSALGRLAADLLTGTLTLDGSRLEYAATGTPTAGTAAHLARAAPCLVMLAERARAFAGASG